MGTAFTTVPFTPPIPPPADILPPPADTLPPPADMLPPAATKAPPAVVDLICSSNSFKILNYGVV